MMDGNVIRVAVVGSRRCGKSALTHRLEQTAQTDGVVQISFDELHDLDLLHSHSYDVVLQVVDATDLENSLLLTPHIIDEHEKIVLAINRYDLLLRSEHSLDMDTFRALVGVPVETVSASTGEGLDSVLSLLVETFGHEASHANPVYHAWEQADDDAYRAYVHGVLTQTLVHCEGDIHTRLERVDKVLTNPWFGFPILALVLCLTFWCTFAIGGPLQDLLQLGVDALYDYLTDVMPGSWFTSLLCDGVILGVGSLLTALPNIIVLFFFLSVMEDSGYMARVAYIMDGFMHRIGLHGRAFIPMLMGFDCNVPAIMAARDIRDRRERTLTMLMIPFMSCSARLPVYILFISTFFVHYRALVLLSLYLLGVVCSFVFALIMKHTPWLRTPDVDCVNELPEFRIPKGYSILRHIRFRVSDFLQKISTVVLCASIVIWVLEYFPAGNLDQLDSSWLASIGRFIAPLMAPLGMDWKMSVCLLTGLPAKEAIASTFAILFGADLSSVPLTAAGAYAFLVFTLLYFPCVATISTLRREAGWRWAAFTVVHSVLVAWVLAFVANTLLTWWL